MSPELLQFLAALAKLAVEAEGGQPQAEPEDPLEALRRRIANVQGTPSPPAPAGFGMGA